jgi:hypothetical protein
LCKTAAAQPGRRTGRAPELRHEALIQRDAFGMSDLVAVVIETSAQHLKSDRRVEQAMPLCPRIWLGS